MRHLVTHKKPPGWKDAPVRHGLSSRGIPNAPIRFRRSVKDLRSALNDMVRDGDIAGIEADEWHRAIDRMDETLGADAVDSELKKFGETDPTTESQGKRAAAILEDLYRSEESPLGNVEHHMEKAIDVLEGVTVAPGIYGFDVTNYELRGALKKVDNHLLAARTNESAKSRRDQLDRIREKVQLLHNALRFSVLKSRGAARGKLMAEARGEK